MTEHTDALPDPVRVERADGVATVRFARPEAMNSLDLATKRAVLEAVREVADDEAVRCVVLTGSGRAFCVGQDLKEHVGLLQRGASEMWSTVRDHYNPLVHLLSTMRKPVIAGVNGVAAGAGASLALACDLRVMAESAGLNTAFAGIGLSCDTGISWHLPRLVGVARAKELLFFPRTVPAQECLELGLVNRVVPDDQLQAVVAELATGLAAGPTQAYAAMRAAVAYSTSHNLPQSLTNEARLMDLTGASSDHRAAVDAFLGKRPPEFTGR